jgi:hypothetical protein
MRPNNGAGKNQSYQVRIRKRFSRIGVKEMTNSSNENISTGFVSGKAMCSNILFSPDRIMSTY